VTTSTPTYGARVSTAAPHPQPRARTLWEEGRRPGPLVAVAAAAGLLVVVVLDLLVFAGLSAFFDVAFVVACVATALAVRPRDFFLVGVLPPLLMAATVVTLALVDRAAVARPSDGLVQAIVSGLAHHAAALGAGYALTLVILSLRQVALRNAGRLRASGPRATLVPGHTEAQVASRRCGTRAPSPPPAGPGEAREAARR
jgi:hypothetical protein